MSEFFDLAPASTLLSGSALVQMISAYFAGLLTVLTPCIYPLIPVTVSLFGITAQLSRSKAFLLSSSYVAGICASYTVLGLLSAKLHFLFGSMLGNFWIAITIALIFFAIALFSLEIVEISFLGRLQSSCSHVGGKGYSGAFLMGSVSGLVAAPCAGPILIGILALASNTENYLWSGALLFSYSLGFGSLFIAIGTFSGLAKTLPRPGAWMNAVKFLTAAGLIAVAIFLVQPFFPEYIKFPLSSSAAWAVVLAALLLGRFSYFRQFAVGKLLASTALAVTVLHLAVGASHITPSATITMGSNENSISWHPSLNATLTAAAERRTIAMVDLFADWCAACKELDTHTFSNSEVQKRLSVFALGKLDFTIIDDPQQAIMDKYSVLGLPAILFLNADGTEIPETRISGFMPPEQFIIHLDRIKEILKNPLLVGAERRLTGDFSESPV